MKRLSILCVFAVLFASLRETSSSAQAISDPGFETPAQAQGKFAYRPAGSAWSFAGNSGLTGNRSAFSSGTPPAPEGGNVALLQSTGLITQKVTGWAAGDYQFTFAACQRNFAASRQVIKVLIDGKTIDAITPGSTTYQTYRTAAFTVAAGDHTIGFQGAPPAGDHTAFLDELKLGAPGFFTAKAKATAWVASSGKMIGLTFSDLAGKPAAPTKILTTPTIAVNGQPLGPLGTGWLTGYHPVTLLATPGGYQIRPGSRVTITAAGNWCTTAAGPCESLADEAAANRAGRPMLATEDLPRKLRIGVNHNQAPTSSGLGFYFPFKNLKYRVGWPPGNRGKLGAPPVAQAISHNGMANGIDGTAYPGIAGPWLVMWDAPPGSVVQFAITSSTPGQCTVTERAELYRAPEDGIGFCRVFDVQPVAAAATADFNVSLAYADPAWSGTAHYDNLWIVQPGDWDLPPAGAQVVLDRSDPWALSRIYLDRVGPNIGSMRWVDSTVCGGNPVSCPYPEMLPRLTDENWGNLSFYREIRGYTSAGPVDVAATPWIYSPFFTDPAQSFPATLGAGVTTAPAAGTRETWTFSDGDSAPLMAGLELRADSEVCRIVSGSGTAWQVNRGSNGTTPATHKAGPVAVSGRRPIRDVLNAAGGMPKALVVQLTTREPHGRTLGNAFGCSGGGWPVIRYTDGSTWNLQGFARQGYVTGPNTLFFAVASTAAGGVPDRVYPLNPDLQQWDYRVSGQIPIEAAAIATGRFAHADLHVNVPVDACDDLVYDMARRVVDNFPSGRRVYAEYGNEPWNWVFTPFYYHSAVMALAVPTADRTYQLAHYAQRAGQVQAIFRKVFTAAGRGGEIHGLVNCQMGSGASQVTPYLEHGLRIGTPFEAAAVAPYWSFEDTAYNRQVAAALDDEQLIDVIGADQRTNPKRSNAWMADVANAVYTFNQKHSTAVRLIGYEGGIEHACPWDHRRDHDLQYNPNWYCIELDWLAWCQQAGLERLHVYSLAQWWNPAGWGGYHTSQQTHSRGDGLNGAADNRAWKARGKPAAVNQDSHVDAVRPQAWLDWNGTLTK